MLARLPLRSKLILVVSVPLFVILGFAGFGVANRLDDLNAQRQYGHLRLPNDALGDAQVALENEGVLTTWYVASAGDTTVGTRLERARTATDRAVSAVDAAGADLSTDDVSGATLRAWNGLERDYSTLDSLRRQADEQAGLPAAFADRYQELTASTIDVSARLARDVEDRRLSDDMLGIVNLRREQAAAADDAMIVMPFLAAGSSNQLNEWISAISTQDDAVTAFLAGASTDERAAFKQARADMPDDPFREAAGDAPSTFPDTSITPDAYYSAWKDRQAVYTATIASVQRVVDNVAADLESEALRGVLAYGLGISLIVLLVLVLAWVMIRSVNRSLHSVTERARDVAEHQLPHLVDTLQRGGETAHIEPIPPLTVEAKDEIGALVRAFNTIQETTVRVAEEQAALLRKGIGDLYVNLARRNQSLVDRQIALLDVLEARADDPDQLASLFELDHLATRVRRNAESLLVLSGAGQSRQWTEAIPILDVVRAASGEIADFARVSFVGFEGDVAVTGNAVADVTHILAELLENATTFSPPGSPVVVAGMLAEHRFVVSITDEGIGMDDARLAAANALLQAPPAPGLSLSRTLGLHVVAHLAARYGVRVQLRRSASNGTTAIVALPATVLTRLEEPAPVSAGVGLPPAAPTTPVTPMATHAAAPPSPPLPAEPTGATPPAAPAPPPPAPVAPVAPEVVPPPAPVAPVGPEVVPPPAAPESVPPAAGGATAAGDPRLGGAPTPEWDPPTAPAPEPVPEPPSVAEAEAIPAWEPSPSPTEPQVYTLQEPMAAWTEPEIVPPAFDPTAPVPPAATPVEPAEAAEAMGRDGAQHTAGADPAAGLPRRTPGHSPLGDAPQGGLPRRTPGDHLSFRPDEPGSAAPEYDARPRPERVHDLLTRHLRGIRDGREDPAAGVTADPHGSPFDAEDRP